MVKLDDPKVEAGVALISFSNPLGPFVGGAYIIARALTDKDDTPDSASISEQDAEIYITQQFGATCDIICKNVMSGTHISLNTDDIGGDVEINQTCSTNATCIISNNSDMIADINYAAKNSSNAKGGSGAFSKQPTSLSYGRQGSKEHLKQISNEECNITSYQQMSDVYIQSKDSTIKGSVKINQEGQTVGSCQMGNSLKAAAYATGTIDQESKSEGGEGKKSEKTGMLMWIFFIVLLLTIVYLVSKFIHNKNN
jgi:hypothetical protein